MGDVSGATVTYGARSYFDFWPYPAEEPVVVDVAALSDSRFVMAFLALDTYQFAFVDGLVIIGDVSGTTITFGDYVSVEPGGVVAPLSVVNLGSFVTAYGDLANGNGAARVGAAPTAVTLASFSAAAQGSGILLEWETASDLDNLGFNVYRAAAADGPRTRLNTALIPSQVPGSPLGASYRFVDDSVEAGVTYFYWIEDVDVYGGATLHGPVSVQVPPGGEYRVYLPLVSR